MPQKRKNESFELLRESCDYLAMRVDVSKDVFRWLDRLNENDSTRIMENPKVIFKHESEMLGKLHIIRMTDYCGNSIGHVQIARQGANGVFSEFHLQGNFWFLYGMEYVESFVNMFERSMDDEIGICRLDYCFDVPVESIEVQKVFRSIGGTKSKKQPAGSANDTWQSISTRRLKTCYYDKKLDIQKEVDKVGNGNRKYDLTIESGEMPYREYFESSESITRIEQVRKGEALREQTHSLRWYLEGGLRTLTIEDLEKKGIFFEAPERMKLKYQKKSEDWMNYSESVLKKRKEHSIKMFQAYAKSLNRLGLLQNELTNMGDYLELEELVNCLDKATKRELEKIF